MLSNQDKAMRVKQVYAELDRKYEEELAEKKANEANLPYVNLYGYPVDPQTLKLLTKEKAQQYGAIIFYKEGRTLKLGVLSPNTGLNQIKKDLNELGCQVDFYMISASSFQHFFNSYNQVLVGQHKSDAIDLLSKDFQKSSLTGLADRFLEISATQLIDQLLGSAIYLNASYIHIEPEAKDIKVRYRIDGVLQDAVSIQSENHHQLISRIKILSKLKLNVTAIPQDGSFSLTYDKTPIDIRVSVIPSAFGESVVMRILRQDKGSLVFEELGVVGLASERILKELEKPNGMILTTGPTGSGKTTTLYAILNKLNEPGVKIITLEDPVEYRIAGITQTPIDSRAGMTFAAGLRAVLRQDPDIVMVGEMRDLETAEIACQAALTGHIVLSTLHTNNGPAAIPRLLDLGVKPFVLAPAINAIIGQRLVRKLCPDCKQEYKLPTTLAKRVGLILDAIPKASKIEKPRELRFYHSVGCTKCNGLGYLGRMGVYEVFIISDEIEKLITKGATTTEIKNQAVIEGMITMAQDGLLKALRGITDVEEVFRVTEE